MGEFFKPLRRKIGVVTLGMACVFAAGWIRSLHFADRMWVPISRQSTVVIMSSNHACGFAQFKYYDPSRNRFEFLSQSEYSDVPVEVLLDVDDSLNFEWSMQFVGWWIGQTEYYHYEGSPFHFAIVRYWSIVLPLTLLSAWLLLSKTRQPKTMPPAAENA